MNNRGISPVIATVLLVLVAVAITMVVATFLTSMTGEQVAKTEEELKGVGGSFLIKSCTRNDTNVTIIFENTGKSDLNNFTIYCFDSTGNTVATDDKNVSLGKLAPGETKSDSAICTNTTVRVRAISKEYPKVRAERDCTTG
ncbi:MAG: archaellin/type IV pilin N-terminal domain-containing protein [Candidatus Diapherotrites archaeon]